MTRGQATVWAATWEAWAEEDARGTPNGRDEDEDDLEPHDDPRASPDERLCCMHIYAPDTPESHECGQAIGLDAEGAVHHIGLGGAMDLETDADHAPHGASFAPATGAPLLPRIDPRTYDNHCAGECGELESECECGPEASQS